MKYGMKFAALALAAMSLFTAAFAENADPFAALDEDAAMSASAIIENDMGIVSEMEGTTLTDEEKQDMHNENLLLIDCGSRGYALQDLDGDGKPELVIATLCPEDGYFGKMVLELYKISEDGDYENVFTSGERDTYYYCGGNRFARIASSGANDSIDTTYSFENGQLVDLKKPADPSEYVQMELTEMGHSVLADEAETAK